MKSVRDKINEGYYKNKFEYPKRISNTQKCPHCDEVITINDKFCKSCGKETNFDLKLKNYNDLLTKYKEDERRRTQEFTEDSLEEVGLAKHEAKDRAFNFAWEKGHSSGMSEVLHYLEEISDVILGSN